MMKIQSIEKKYLLAGGAFIIAMIVAVMMMIFMLSDNKSRKDMLELENLAKSIRNFYKNRPNYWGLDTNFAISNNLYQKGENGIDTIVGQGFEGYKVMPGNTTFDIAYKNLNHQKCVYLLSSVLSENQKIVLVSISVQGIDEKTFDWGGENSLPITTGTAKKMCKNDNTNNILWTFK